MSLTRNASVDLSKTDRTFVGRVAPPSAVAKGRGQALGEGLLRHWLAWVNAAWGVLVTVPWLAPLFMKWGWTGAANVIYFIYGFLCHQLANRSFFLFGPRWMYDYTELLPYAADANTWWGLRAFRGTPALGYKVAWSDRMVWLYGAIFVAGLAYALLRRWWRPLPLRWFVVLLIPLVLDGGTHAISDLFGVGQGFRYTNAWLAALTQHALPPWFYEGNKPGTFNFWMRFITGVMAGAGFVAMLYPRLDRAIRRSLPH